MRKKKIKAGNEPDESNGILKGGKEMKNQELVVLNELKNRDLTVREIVTSLWINSPTKIISNLRKQGHNIKDIGKKFSIYHLSEINNLK